MTKDVHLRKDRKDEDEAKALLKEMQMNLEEAKAKSAATAMLVCGRFEECTRAWDEDRGRSKHHHGQNMADAAEQRHKDPQFVKTTPQMIRFRDAKVCNNLATDEIDDHRIQSDYKCTIGLQKFKRKELCTWYCVCVVKPSTTTKIQTDFHTEHMKLYI